jgi:hypothetical protein
MKLKAGSLAITVFAAILLVHPQTVRKVPPQTPQAIGKEIEQLEVQLRIASLKGDAAWFDLHLTDSYTEIDAQGKVITRADMLQSLRSGELAYDTMNLSEGSARIFNNDTVLLVQKEELAGGLHQQNFSGTFRCSRLWIKQNMVWQLAASQLTRIPG